ncbi:MAG: hypothetical protein A2V66_04290 [Ignavibacteria bacterium RBG_13_36_8]|nr:MAG: hypothetical protein A2V66_04290 [Ignavibacteria bacterium RBG_13_36_8]
MQFVNLKLSLIPHLFINIIGIICISMGCGGYITDNAYVLEEDFSDRVYEYFIPSTYDTSKPLPIVFVFHGAQSSSISMRMATDFDTFAEENDFIVIYPNAVIGYWNVNDDCSRAYGENNNDIGFVEYLISEFQNRYSIDLNRIYACGFSLGAIFTMSIGLEKSNMFAAIASIAGNISPSIANKFLNARRVPIMILHGMLDESILWEGGGTGACERLSVPEMVRRWASHNGCNQNPSIEDLPDTGEEYIHVVRETYNNCRDNAETIFYRIEGGIHEWFTFEEFNATEALVDFFFRHSL